MAAKKYNRYQRKLRWVSRVEQPQNESVCYVDQYGYYRFRFNNKLVHRSIAYTQLYLPNRRKYPLSWNAYVVHHKDGNKHNNRVNNLQILTWNEHAERHPHLQHHEGEFD